MTDRSRRDGPPGEERLPPRPPWRNVNGIVIVDKPVGLTSNAVLQRVRRVYRARKAGHTGSLDPLASGVLPLCFGEATKLSGLLLDAAKTYEVTGRLGVRTETGDLDGKAIEQRPISAVDEAALAHTLAGFRGDIQQVPPMYSALKHQGRRLYALARKGESVERPPRPVTIHRLDCLGWSSPDLRLRVSCSKGTYIRTLIEDIGIALGTCAHVVSLRRLAAGPFNLADAIGLSDFEAPNQSGEWLAGRLLAPDTGVPGLPRVRLAAEAAGRLCHGQAVPVPEGQNIGGDGLVRVYGPEDGFLGLGQSDGQGQIVPKRLFNLTAGGE